MTSYAVTYISASGKEETVEVDTGTSLMQAAVDNGIEGISGDCGGFCSCATCHAYIEKSWLPKLHSPSEEETMMLEGHPKQASNSRLTCQIIMSPELDGIALTLPESQY